MFSECETFWCLHLKCAAAVKPLMYALVCPVSHGFSLGAVPLSAVTH